MAYIGNSPLPIGNFSATTHNGGTTTFTMGQAPGTKNAVLVFIDGVRQDPLNYSIAGATLTLGTAAPAGTDNVQILVSGEELGVNVPADDSVTTTKILDDSVTTDKLANAINTTIAANTAKVTNATHTGDVTGATALTIAVDAVDIPMLSATGTADATTFLRGDNTWNAAAGGLTHFSQFRLNTNFSNDQDPITSNLTEVATPVGFGKLPNVAAGVAGSMTVSSGIFTFPSTGLWLVQGNFFLIQPSNGAGGNVCNVSTTINHSAGPTWAVTAQFTMGDYYGDKFEGSASYIFDVTDTAECKVRFGVNVTLTDTVTQGNSHENLTYFTFTKLADT